MTALRDKILTTSNIPKERVVLKSFDNADVEVRALTTGQRLKMLKDCTVDGGVDQVKLFPHLIIATTYDPNDGTPVFTATDVEPLQDTYAAGLDELLEVTLRLNGFDDPKAAAKNSETVPTSTTPSLSLSVSDSQSPG